MNLPNPTPRPADEEPFVHEECGDTMWDAVLAQPDPAAETRPRCRPSRLRRRAKRCRPPKTSGTPAIRKKEPGLHPRHGVAQPRRVRARPRAHLRARKARKWAQELDYKLKKELWSFSDNRIAVRFEYEFRDAAGQWFRAYGNELWEFAPSGLMQRRYASINDAPIRADERRPR